MCLFSWEESEGRNRLTDQRKWRKGSRELRPPWKGMWGNGTERPGKTGLCDQKVGTGTLEFGEETALSVISPDWSYGLWLREIEMATKVGNIKKMWNYYIISSSWTLETFRLMTELWQKKKTISQMKDYNRYGRHLGFDCPTSIASSSNAVPWFPLGELLIPLSWSVGQVGVYIPAPCLL